MTATLSLDAVQEREMLVWVLPATVRLVGADGAVVSGAGCGGGGEQAPVDAVRVVFAERLSAASTASV